MKRTLDQLLAWRNVSSTFTFALFLALGTGGLTAAEYHVGPGQTPGEPELVPWKELMPGDTVFFHYRPDPYVTKFVLARRGEPGKPIRVVGVPDPATGALPKISGTNAAVPPGLNFHQQDRSIIKVGGAGFPGAAERPGYIEIEGLDVSGGRGGGKYIDHEGKEGTYRVNVAAIHIEIGDQITVRNCILHNNSQGLTTSYLAHDILVERCHIHDNGNLHSITEHNIYSSSLRLTFLYNRLGPLSPGARGNNLKDRSAGLTVGWNWMVGGNRLLDLVDTRHPEIFNTPEYKWVKVFGNVMVKLEGQPQIGRDPGSREAKLDLLGVTEPTPPPSGIYVPPESNQIIHYGGDSTDEPMYRNGVLWFEHNTVISQRSGATIAFRMSTHRQFAVASNNIWSLGDHPHSRLYFLNEEGTLHLAGPNFVPTTTRDFAGELSPLCRVIGGQYLVRGGSPKYADVDQEDYRPQSHIKAASAAGIPLPALANWPIATRIYSKHQSYEDLAQPNPSLGALPPLKKSTPF